VNDTLPKGFSIAGKRQLQITGIHASNSGLFSHLSTIIDDKNTLCRYGTFSRCIVRN